MPHVASRTEIRIFSVFTSLCYSISVDKQASFNTLNMNNSKFQNFKSKSAGKIIGIFSLLGHFLKFSAIICILIWPINHHEHCAKIAKGTSRHIFFLFWMKIFDDFNFAETIYLELLASLSAIGIISSTILILAVAKRKSGLMIWWICSQGITVVYQILVSVDFFFCCKLKEIESCWAIFIIVSVILYLILQAFNLLYIVKLYQNIVDEKNSYNFSYQRKSPSAAAITPEDVLHI